MTVAAVTNAPLTDNAQPPPRWRLAVIPGAALVATETLVIVAVERLVRSGLPWRSMLLSYGLTNAWLGATFAPFGALVSYRRPRLAIGWLFSIFGVLYAASAFGIDSSVAHFVHDQPGQVSSWVMFVGLDLWTPAVAVCFPLILLLFPDGRFASRFTRRLATAALVVGVVWVVAWTLQNGVPIRPSGSAQHTVTRIQSVTNIGMLVSYVVVVGTLFALRQTATARVRSQLTWLVAGSALAVVLFLPTGWGVTNYWATSMLIGVPLFPLACAIAILRHRLFDLDIAINRTLVFLTLSGGLLGIYLAVVTLARAAIGHDAELSGALVAAVLVAVVFAPARAAVQGLVDRLMFGARSDPSRALTTVTASLESSSDGELLAAVTSVCESLRFPYAAIRLDGRQIGDGDPTVRPEIVPLRFRSQLIGELLVWPRRGQHGLDPEDLDVLRLIASPLATAAYSAQLSEQLQRSREQILDAQDVERDRLHRDLHDGLGPALTAVALKADAAGNVIAADGDRAKTLLIQIADEARAAIADVRRISHGLRPPTLEGYGLLRAIRHEAARFTSRLDGHPLVVTTELPSSLPVLRDEVASAAYHIAMEALTNVARHSTASQAVVTIRVGDVLCLQVLDDGAADGEWTEGFGLASMRRRAKECGGSFVAGSTAEGASVRVELPLAASDDPR